MVMHWFHPVVQKQQSSELSAHGHEEYNTENDCAMRKPRLLCAVESFHTLASRKGRRVGLSGGM